MALSEGFQRYLGALGGGGPVAPLAQGLVTGLGSYAEQQKKKREEERAREREGLTFALNQAIEAGDEQAVTPLVQSLYGNSVDGRAVGLAARMQREEKDRAKKQSRLDSILASMKYVSDPADRERLGTEAGRLQAEILGVPETITRKTGQMVPSPTETETYTEQVPVPGTEFKAGAMLPVEQAQQMAKERGLSGAFAPAFGPYAGGLEQRRVLKDIPALTTTETRTRPKMVEGTETVPQFKFGQAVGATTPLTTARISGINRDAAALLSLLTKRFNSLPVKDRESLRKEKTALEQTIRNVQAQAIANDGLLPEGVTWPEVRFSREVETTEELEKGARLQLLKKRLTLADVQAELGRVRAKVLPQSVGAQVTRAAAAMRSASASESRASTAAKSLIENTKNRADRDRLTMWVQDQTNARKLADIDERGRKAGEAEADRKYPKKERERLPEAEREAWDKARQDVATVVADAYVAKETDRILKSVPRPALRVEAVGGAKPAPAKPVPAPQRRAAPTTSSGAGAFSGLPGARQ